MGSSRASLRGIGCAAAIAGLVQGLSTPVRADGGAVSGDGRTDGAPLLESVVRAPLTSRPRDPSAATTVIEAADYAGELRSVGQLAAMVPGVVLRDVGPGQMAALSIRGSTGDQLLVSMDGIPLTAPGGGAVDLSRIPPGFVERLEVVRGVVGARFGPGALGGVLNVVTRAPESASFAGEASGGSFGTGAGSLAGSFRAGAGSYFLALSGGHSQGDFAVQKDLTPEVPDNDALLEERRGNNVSTLGGLLGRARWDLGDAGAASLLVTTDAFERGVPGPLQFTFARSLMRVRGGLLGASWEGAAGPVDLLASAWGRADTVEFVPEDGPSLLQSGRSAGAVMSAGTVLGRHRLLADLSLGGDWMEGPAVGAQRRLSAAVGVLDEIVLGGSWRLALAARGDRMGDFDALSGRAAVTGRAGPVRLALGVGHSFRAPTFTELFYEAGPLSSNPSLRPEVATGADATALARRGPFEAQLSGFLVRYRDIIVYEIYPPLRARPLNIGAAQILGAEVETAFRPASLPLRLAAGYSWLSAENRRPSEIERGKILPYRAPHRLFARAAWSSDRLAAFIDARFASAVPRNRANTHSMPAQADLAAGAGVRVGPGLWLHAKVQNLLDDRDREDLFGYPLPGRSFFVVLRANVPPEQGESP